MKHFLKLLDCTKEEITELLDLADRLKQYVKEGKEHHFLKGKTLGMIFEKSSTRRSKCWRNMAPFPLLTA